MDLSLGRYLAAGSMMSAVLRGTLNLVWWVLSNCRSNSILSWGEAAAILEARARYSSNSWGYTERIADGLIGLILGKDAAVGGGAGGGSEAFPEFAGKAIKVKAIKKMRRRARFRIFTGNSLPVSLLRVNKQLGERASVLKSASLV